MIKIVTSNMSKHRFKATLCPLPATARGTSSLLLALPKKVSAKLASLGTTKVEGTINGFPFPRAALQSDDEVGYWLRVNRTMREMVGADVGDVVIVEIVEIVPVAEEREAKVPADLKKALISVPKARLLWNDITPLARQDWILWVESAKRAETRTRRIEGACSMLASGKRRVCCFDSYKARLDKICISK